MRQTIRYSIPSLFFLLHLSFIMAQHVSAETNSVKAADIVMAPQLSEIRIGETSAVIFLEKFDSADLIRLRYRDVSEDNWLCMENAVSEPLKLGGLMAETNYEVRIIVLNDKGKSSELGFCFTTASLNEAMNNIKMTKVLISGHK